MKNFITFRSDMRKALVALLLMVSFSGFLKAQYVTIPDTAFVSWLHNNGLASCMSGNQLDTTCTALANITSLECYNVPIKDLTGAQYFKNATELDCHNDSLYTIPAFPPNLTLLTCYSNNLSTFPAFPVSLTTIACWKNKFTTLPTLPPFLTQLESQQNQLTALPALPATLTSLACYNNQLTSLPTLPDSLQGLYCQFNQLTALPSLPGTLTYLVCYNNLLSSIPALPPVMNQLFCYNNPNLYCLPRLTTIGTLEFDSAVVSCIPNYGTVTTSIPLVTHIPLCQPGNAHGCLTAITAQIASGSSDTICPGTSVTLTCNPSGGTSPYSFAWSPSVGISSVNTQGATASPTTTTTYTVTVTDATSSTATASVTIGVRSGPQITNFSVTNLSCYGNGSGSVCPSVSGGIFPYTFMWSNFMSSQCISGLSAGNYHVVVTDVVGCQAQDSATVTQPAAILDSITATNTSCYGASDGMACVHSSGGVGSVTYNWSNGATSACITGLVAGVYTVTATDANACSSTATAAISQPAPIHDSLAVMNVSCYGRSDGSICIYSSGGLAPYLYQWSNGATGQCISGLSIATYVVTAIDANSCTATSSATINQPALINLQVAATGPHVLPDTVNLTVSGGTQPFTVYWGNGHSSNLPDSTGNYVYDTAGIYNIGVIDAHNCSTGYTLPVDTILPLVVNAGNNATICLYNNVFLGGNPTAMGGIPPYNYAWSDGLVPTSNPVAAPSVNNTYTLTVTDANSVSATSSVTITVGPGLNANFSAPPSSACLGFATNFTDLSNPSTGISSWSWDFGNGNTSTLQNPIETFVTAGVYPVKLAVSNGICTADTIIPFTVNNIPTSTFTATSPVCEGQNATITYTGSASANGLFTWNVDGATIASGTGAGPYQLNWLTAGTKNITLSVTDHGCTSTITTMQVVVNALPGFIISADTTICAGASVTLTASGAITYSWSPATWLNATNTATVIATPAATTTYTVTGTSSNCGATASVTVNIDALKDSIAITNGGCSLCDYVSGGVAPYTYLWSNGATTQCISSLEPGMYMTMVVDNKGCTTLWDTAIYTNNLHYQVFTPDTSRVPDSVSLNITGGNPPYSVSWGDGQYTQEIDSSTLHIYSASGLYYIMVGDSLGCGASQFRIDAGCTDQCVWPGDANYDGLVDNNDLLAIGLGYDTTGYARVNPTINFIPQYCQNWADTLIGAINYKHVDCNGDGTINADDTSAIMLNYSLTHARGGSGGIWKIDAPALYIKTSPDTVADGQILTATLSLGNAAMPVANVYALAFTYNFDPLVVDTTDVQLSFGNSWLFGTGDHINISKNFYHQGQIQAAATRIDHANRSGYGAIATVSMKITTGNINGKNLQYYFMNNYISNLTVIDNEGRILVVNAGTDSAVVSYTPTGIIPVKNAEAGIQIFPNPASDQLNILSGRSEIEEITIVDLTGQEVIHQNRKAGNYSVIDIAELSAGVYMIKLKTGAEEYHSRFVKVGPK